MAAVGIRTALEVGAVAGESMVSATEDQTVALDEEAKRLQLEQVKAEARKAIAEAQNATLSAQLPTSDIKPLEGKVEVGTGVGLVAQLVAHKLLGHAASVIAESVKGELGDDKSASVLVVENRSLAATDWAYGIVKDELRVHDSALDRAIRMLEQALGEEPVVDAAFLVPALSAVLPAFGAASAVVGATASLVGMFRTDYSVAGKEFTIGNTPLVTAVAERMLEISSNVTVDQFSVMLDGGIVSHFRNVRKKRILLEQRSLTLKSKTVQPIDRRLEDLRAETKDVSSTYTKGVAQEKPPPKLDELKTRLEDLKKAIRLEEDDVAENRARVAMAESLIAKFDAFATAATVSTKEGAYPPLVAAALRERLHDDPGKYTHVLYVGVEASGGETITRHSLFRRSGQVGFMGGAQVSHLLLDVAANKAVAAGTQSLLGHLKYDLDKAKPGSLNRVDLKDR